MMEDVMMEDVGVGSVMMEGVVMGVMMDVR